MKTQRRHNCRGPIGSQSTHALAAVALAGGLLLTGCATSPVVEPGAAHSVSAAPITVAPVPETAEPEQLAPLSTDAQLTPLSLDAQLTPLSDDELAALLGPVPDPDLMEVVSGLQLLNNQEYRAVLALNAEQLDPKYSQGWQFTAPSQIDLEGLRADGARVVGHVPSRITGVSKIEQSPEGVWQVTALMSQIEIEIFGPDGAVLLDTRDSGPFVATFDLTQVLTDGAK